MTDLPGRLGARIAGSPVFFAVLFGFGSVLGVYANLYPHEIVEAITVRSGYFGGSFARHAAVFYVILILLVLFTGFVQWSADAARQRDETRRAADEQALVKATEMLHQQIQAADLRRAAAEERLLESTRHLEAAHGRRADAEARLIDSTRRLRHLVRTLPPAAALSTFDDIEVQAQDVIMELQERHYAGRYVEGADGLETAEVAAAIRVVLKGVVRLVAAFDAGGHDTTYFASLARFVRRATLDTMPEAQRTRLVQRMLAWPGGSPLDGVRGVLVLDRELSTVSPTDGASAHGARMTEVVFAIPDVELERVEAAPEPRWRVLPGAPLAFCQAASVLYHDQESMLEWCRRRGEYAAGTIERLEAYLRSDAGTFMQGSLSVPILRYDEPGGGDDRIPAVLNVHCNRAGFLRGRHVRRHLLPLLYPLIAALHRLLSMLALVEETAGESRMVVEEGGRQEDAAAAEDLVPNGAREAGARAAGSRKGFASSLSRRHEAIDRLTPKTVVAHREDGMTTMRLVESRAR